MILDCPGGPNIIVRALIYKKEEGESEFVVEDLNTEEIQLVGRKQKSNYEPRNEDRLSQLKEMRTDVSLEPGEETQTC